MLEILREKADPQQVGTPESIARQRRIADALMAQGSDYSPIQSWTQGAARVANALAGVYREHKADAAEKAGLASDKANLAALIGGAFGGGSAGVPISGATAGSAPVASPQAAADAAPVQMAGDAAGKADQLFQYLKTKGATDNEALMLTGAANNESSYNPAATHDPRNGVPTGYGLWGHNLGRLDLRGKDMFGQADAALAELRNRPEAQMLATAKTPEEIARAEMFYERPAGFTTANPAAGHNYSGRLATLRGLYAKYGTAGAAPPAGVQVASADPNFVPQMPPSPAGITDAPVPSMPPAGPGASLSPQDMATLAQRYAQAAPAPSPAAGITDAPLTPGAAVAPPGLGPMAAGPVPAAPPPAMTGTVAPPVAPSAAAMQAAPPGAKDSIIQSMIARGINPATGQPLPNPGIGRVAQALAAGGGAPQTVPAVSPAVQRVAGAMAPAAAPQGAPASPAGPAPVAAQGASPQVAAAVQALANPYASAASKMLAQKIISDEMESRDPLRQLQVQKLQLELGGGTKDEQRMRQLQIQKAEKELAAPPKQWQKLDDSTLYDPATGETKRIDAGPAGAAIFKGTSVEAQSLNGLVQAGKLTPEQAMQIGAGKTVTDPATGAIIFMTPDGIFGQRPGQPPQPIAPPTASPQGAPAAPAGPPAAAPIAAPAPQQNGGLIPITGPKPAAKLTEAEQKAKLLSSVMEPEIAIIDKTFPALSQLGNQIAGMAPGSINSYLTSPDYQRATNSLKEVIASYLYVTSGATAPPAEIATRAELLTPKPGEDASSIADKLARIHNMANAVRGATGQQPPAAAQAPEKLPPIIPPVGTIESGYRFKGGDPADARNWEKAQ